MPIFNPCQFFKWPSIPQIARDMKKDYVLIKGMGLALTYGHFSMAFQEDNEAERKTAA